MTKILRKENPRLYKQMISDQQECAKHKEAEDRLFQEAMNDSQSLEAKIERAVTNYVDKATEKLQSRQEHLNQT